MKTLMYAVLVVIGFFAGYLVSELTEKEPVRPPAADDYSMPATKPLFSASVCRQSADFLNGRMEKAGTPAERNLYAIASATLREAELFALFESKLQEMDEETRKRAIADEAAWQQFYQEEMFRPLTHEGGNAAALESSLRSGSLIFDRILYWSCSVEGRASYDALKNLSFTDRYLENAVDLTLREGIARNGSTQYQLLPGITCGDANAGCGLVLSGEGSRQLICWRNGKMVKSVKVPAAMELICLSFNDDRSAVNAEYRTTGKSDCKILTVKF